MNNRYIYNEDCRDTMARWARAGRAVDFIVTSPPYPGVANMWGELFTPERFDEAHAFLNEVWNACADIIAPGCKLAINIANTKRRPYLPNTAKVYEWASGRGDIEPLGEVIWDKGYGQLGTAWGSYCNPSDPSLGDRHEYILIFRKAGERNRRAGYFLHPRLFKSWRNSIWSIAPASATAENHVAPFPREIPRRLILMYTYPDETVYDPFVGSGTSIIAALECGRRGLGSEMAREYAALAERNINDYLRQPRLHGDAKYFRKRDDPRCGKQQIGLL